MLSHTCTRLSNLVQRQRQPSFQVSMGWQAIAEGILSGGAPRLTLLDLRCVAYSGVI